jgi:hypothetical protein
MHRYYGHHITPARVLFAALARSEKTWKLGFIMGPGQKPRERQAFRLSLKDAERIE